MSVLQRFNYFNTGAPSTPTVTYTSTRQATATCGAGTTGAPVTRTATRTSTANQQAADDAAYAAALAAATAALVCTVDSTGPPPEPTFNTTLNPGESADVVTWNGAPGTQFKFNAPLPASGPAPATMLVSHGGQQVGQADFNGAGGQACAVVVDGTTYLTTFQNSDNVTV